MTVDSGGGRWLCTTKEVLVTSLKGGRVVTVVSGCNDRRWRRAIILTGGAMGSNAEIW